MPPHSSLTLSYDPVGDGAAPDLDRAVRRGVPDRVDHQVAHDPRQTRRVSADRQPRRSDPAAQADRPGPRHRVGAGDRVGHHVAEGDGLGGQRAGRRPGCRDSSKRSSTMPRQAVDLGADLPVVAARVVGDAVLERLGHGPQAGQRGAQVVRDPGDELAPGGLQPGLAQPRLLQPLAGQRRAPRRAPASSLGPRGDAAKAPRGTQPPGVLAQRLRPPRPSPAAERRGDQQCDQGRDRHHPVTTPQVVPGDEHRPGDRDAPPASTAPIATATTSTSCQKNDACRIVHATPTPTTPDGEGAPGRHQRRSAAGRHGHDAASQPVADAPHGLQAAGVGSGRPRPSPAAGGRARSPSTGRRRSSPRPARSSSLASERLAGVRRAGRRAGRTRGR